MRRIISRSAIVLALLAVLFGTVVPSGASADVGIQDTRCDSNSMVGDLCLWWNRNFETSSALIGFFFDECDHLLFNFPNNGQGAFEHVGNNAGSFRNNDPSFGVTVFFNPCGPGGARPTGPSQFYAPGQQRNCTQAGPNICNNNRANIWS